MGVATTCVQLLLPFLAFVVVRPIAGCVQTTHGHSICGHGCNTPSWMWNDLEVECEDNLGFGRSIGNLCRNVNLNVGKAIIVVHGSNSGRNDMWTGNGGWGNMFLKRGYMVFSIDYVSSECEMDIRDASAFLQNPVNMPNANFIVDANNIGVFGFSFGAVCASRSAIFESTAQQAAVLLSGSVANGPLNDIHEDVPPVMVIWGDEDCTMDVSRGDNLYAALQADGLDVEYHVFPKDGMGNAHTQVYREYPCSQEWASDFMDRKLGTTIAAPTWAPTVPGPTMAPTAPIGAPVGSWELTADDTKCRNSEDSVDVSNVEECWAFAEANGALVVSYKQNGQCRVTESNCNYKSGNGWQVWEMVMPASPSPTAASPTPSPTTSSPTLAPTDGPMLSPTAAPTSESTALPTPTPTAAPTLAPTPATNVEWVIVQSAARCAGPTSFVVADEAACQTAAAAGGHGYYSYRSYDFMCVVASECSLAEKPYWKTYTAVALATPSPTGTPSAAPTLQPTPAPTTAPTTAPTPAPTPAPTAAPTAAPTWAPTPGFLATWVVAENGAGAGARCGGLTASVVADEAACQAAATAGGHSHYSYRAYDFKCVVTSECALVAKEFWNTFSKAR